MSSTTYFSDAEGFQRQSDEFISWLSQKPDVRVNPAIQIRDMRSQNAGRGVVACSNIQDGEELFAIPREVVLDIQNSHLADHIPQDLEELGPWLSLILVMMHEYLLGAESRWAQYFLVLPINFDTLMFWTETELSELQASAIIEKIGKRDADETILEKVIPVVRANPHLFPPTTCGLASFDNDEGTQVLLSLAHRMGSLIMAYAFDIEKNEDEEEEEGEDGYLTDEDDEQLPKGMVPLADMLNADADRNNARLFREEKFLVMRAIKPITAGAEIFNDYGQIPRADLLRRYGYVTDNYAQYDVVELPLSLLCAAGGLDDGVTENYPQLQLLDDLGILDDGYCIPRPSPQDLLEDILPEELLALVKILTLSPEQLLEYRAKNKPPKPTLSPREAQLLLAAVQARTGQYPSTIEQDEATLKQISNSAERFLSGSTRRKTLALQVRIGEKEVLRQLSAMLSQFLASAQQNSDGNGAAKRTAQGDFEGQPGSAKARKF